MHDHGGDRAEHGDGGLSEYVRVKDSQLYPLPDSLSFTQGALVEPAACAVERCTWAGPVRRRRAGNRRRTNRPADGNGCPRRGRQAVFISETVPGRRELAGRSLQATVLDPSTTDVPRTVQEATDGWGADVVFECSASPRAFADALAATRKGGTMVQFGVFTQEVPLHPADLTNFERRIQGNLAYARPTSTAPSS